MTPSWERIALLICQPESCSHIETFQPAPYPGAGLGRWKDQIMPSCTHSTHAYYYPGTAIVAAAVRCRNGVDPSSVARIAGVDVSSLTERGSVQIEGEPASPYHLRAGEIRAIVSLDPEVIRVNGITPNEGWTASDHRCLDSTRSRVLSEASERAESAVPPCGPETTWVWADSCSFMVVS
jgi:hypothetical protein